MLTLFPEMFPGPLGLSLAGQALARGDWRLQAVQIRDFGLGRHKTVDDTPAGGGAGMVLRADVMAACIDTVCARPDMADLPRIYLSPRGEKFDAKLAHELAEGPGVLLVAGRFEGLDERVISGRALREISLGDFVLSGGEIAALALMDACVRLLPGVIGAQASLAEESFVGGLLEYPQYTRPRDFEGMSIPNVLLSGDHARIAAWRRLQSLAITANRRPDLNAKRLSESSALTTAGKDGKDDQAHDHNPDIGEGRDLPHRE